MDVVDVARQRTPRGWWMRTCATDPHLHMYQSRPVLDPVLVLIMSAAAVASVTDKLEATKIEVTHTKHSTHTHQTKDAHTHTRTRSCNQSIHTVC